MVNIYQMMGTLWYISKFLLNISNLCCKCNVVWKSLHYTMVKTEQPEVRVFIKMWSFLDYLHTLSTYST